jgi:hypothetical protein
MRQTGKKAEKVASTTVISGGRIEKQRPQRFATIRGKKVPMGSRGASSARAGNASNPKGELVEHLASVLIGAGGVRWTDEDAPKDAMERLNEMSEGTAEDLRIAYVSSRDKPRYRILAQWEAMPQSEKETMLPKIVERFIDRLLESHRSGHESMILDVRARGMGTKHLEEQLAATKQRIESRRK